MALYGNVFVASLIYRPPSLVPILTALLKYTHSPLLLSIWTASQWVITALRFVSIIIHLGKLDTVCNNCVAKQ